MSNKLLKKVLSDLSSCPRSELETLIKAELLESDIYTSLLDSLSEGHIIIDHSGVVIYYNKTVLQLISASVKHRLAEGKSISDVVKDNDINSFIQRVICGEEKPEPKDFILQFGQEMRTIRVMFASLNVGKKDYIDIKFSDISEQIRSQARLRRSENLASMTTMAAGIAHEIKNPLAAMKIHVQLLERTLDKKGVIDKSSADRFLAVMDEEIDHLNSIAVDFLYAVKPMNTELRLSSINDIISELVSFLEPEAKDKNIALDIRLEEFLPRVELDSKYIRQALLNLIQNSFAAMPDGGNLQLSTALNGDFVTLKVIDNGIGIADDKISKIFEPYYTTKATGTGLGLTMVYKVVKEHHGDIHVSSEVGKGTCFTLEFPVPVSQRVALEGKKHE